MVIYLWANMLIALYHNTGTNAPPANGKPEKQSWWHFLTLSATSQAGNGQEPSYAFLIGDEIELGGQGRVNGSGRAVFDADEEEEEDERSSYWERDTLAGEEAKELPVR